ncbi:sulfate/molybdate ABC transporter ATP-binding protein [Clostridium nigeriense]|uniref:sulfate/molybdate ABC transporter ATP-binding protein n=1 Tax=Clostridium nigeriense TaxID=1805470 RepID=UPI003D33CE57
MSIEIKEISKKFGNFNALDNINLKIETGELVALLGPSGSGKTTLLRIIAGLEEGDKGTILFDGLDNTNKKTKERNVGFVFQHYALFKQMNVFENVAFGLKVKKKKSRLSNEKINEKVMELLTLVKMENMANRYPNQLSGGQKQRIALARALAVEPRVLLLDEPFGALDAKVRKELRRWLRKLHEEFNITSVFVTHDQEEALDVADRIVVLNGGKIEQVGTPEEVYDNPSNEFVYNFLGNVNLFHKRIQSNEDKEGNFILNNDSKELNSKIYDDYAAKAINEISYVRPHDIEILLENEDSAIKSKVTFIRAVGPVVNIELIRLDNSEIIEAQINKDNYKVLNIKVGQEVYIRPKDITTFIIDYTI